MVFVVKKKESVLTLQNNNTKLYDSWLKVVYFQQIQFEISIT